MRVCSSRFVIAALFGSLLLPHFAFAQHAFESEIQAYEAQDRVNPPPLGSVVITGSSSIAKWTTIQSDLAPLDIIPRGFGGSTTDDLDYYLQRIVLVYQPRAVVIYEGENDIDNGQTPTYVANRMTGILARISAALPNARVYVISIKPTPAHISEWNGWETWANQMLAALCASDARYTYIDTASHLIYPNLQLVPGVFDTDGVHLTYLGYQKWTSAIVPVLLPQQLIPMPADSTPPVAPNSVTATAQSSSQIDVTWTGASDSGSGLAGYNFFRNGQRIASTISNKYSDTGLAANTSYTYTVTAYDRSPNHNESVQSPPASATTPTTSTAPPTVSLQVSPSTVPIGGTTQLTWTSTNATACTASGAWAGAKTTSGSTTSGAISANATFTLTCTGAGGTASDTKSVAAVGPPTVNLVVSPANVASGGTTALSWTTSYATSCTATGGWSGAEPPVGNATSGALSANTTFTLTCTGVGGTGSDSKTVTVAAAPTVSLTVSPATIASGAKTTVSWTSTNASSCSASGGWSGGQSTSGSATSGALTANTTFTLTCTGSGGTASDSKSVTVIPAPTVTLTAAPASVTSGAKTNLSWTSTNATSCTASGGWSGGQSTSGSATSGALTANTTFTLTCTGTGGTGSDSKTVTVTAAPAPTVSITATPSSVTSGGNTSLSWTSTNATSCTASGGWSGAQSTNGSATSGALSSSTTFTLTCTGTGGSAASSATVNVTAAPPPPPPPPPPGAPTVQLTDDSPTIAYGGTEQLKWTSTNATACSASGAWTGTRGTSGTEATPALTASSTFTLTCSGSGGNATTSVTIAPSAAPMPTATLTANPTSVAPNGTTALSWTSTDATSCTASNGWTGSRPASGTETSAALTDKTTFALACTGPGGTANASVDVTVTYPEPTVTLNATPGTVATGTTAKLSWTTQDASDCSASGGWSGKKALDGDEMTQPIATQSAFSLSCSGPGGSTDATVMVKVQDSPPPTDTVTVTSTSKGGGGALDWWDVSALLALLALRKLPDRTRAWRRRPADA
jgi:lysophospholipase L1-like esterase